jgi:multidrug/hemolysin transport system permease protein
MNKIWNLTNRNLKRYFRDKGALFFSFLSVFIVVVLYVVFLANMQIKNLQMEFGNSVDSKQLVYSWIIGGLLCIPAVSVPLFTLTFKIEDAAEGTQDDLLVAPVKRYYIMFGYVITAWITGVIMTMLTLVLGEAFIVAKGGTLLSAVDYLKIFGIIVLSVLAYTGFSFFIIIRLRTNSSISIINTILNTLVGFFAGLYIPLGLLPDGIATVVKVFPLSHSAAIFRNIMTERSLQQTFQELPSSAISNMKQVYGIDLIIGQHLLSCNEMVAYLMVFGLIFYIGSVLILKHYKRK